jgi:hypothetical protein
MNKKEFIKRAVQLESTAFTTSDSNASLVNPTLWDRQLREFEQATLVVTPLAEQFDLTMPGADMRVTIDAAPSTASLLTETTDVSVSSISVRQLTFTPKEYGAAYQVTKKESVRSFFPVMDRMTRKLSYSLSLQKDSVGIAALQAASASANNFVYLNSKTAATAYASTDTLTLSQITTGIAQIESSYYQAKTLVITPSQKKQLLDNTNLSKASEFGTRAAIANGLIGELFGLTLYVSSNPAMKSSSCGKALLLGASGSGEGCFAYATKRAPAIETEYHPRGRYWDIVATEEYDFQVLHPSAVVQIWSYS